MRRESEWKGMEQDGAWEGVSDDGKWILGMTCMTDDDCRQLVRDSGWNRHVHQKSCFSRNNAHSILGNHISIHSRSIIRPTLHSNHNQRIDYTTS